MTRTIVDTDPGTDDALAIMMALSSRDLDVLGITTVGGNARLAHTTRNAVRILEYLGRADLPVSRGSARPLRGRFHYGYQFHGPAGLGVRLPSPRTALQPVRAPEFIVEMASTHRRDLVVLALGPLTNIAMALSREPRLAGWVRGIVVMGGAVDVPGNVSRHAEFNIYNDPEAASVVFSSGIPITLVGLNVTRRTYFARRDHPWVMGDTRTARLSRRVLANWFGAREQGARFHLHDPLAVAAAIRPGLLSYRRARVAVESADPRTVGRLAVTYGDGPVQVAVAVDVERSMATIVDLLSGSVGGPATA